MNSINSLRLNRILNSKVLFCGGRKLLHKATVFSTTLDSLASWAFSSRSSLLSARIWRFSSQRSALMPCNSRLRAWLPSCTAGCSSSPSAAWLRWVTRADCCFSSSARFTASAHASRQSSSCSGLFQRAHSGFCRPNFAAFGCFDQRSHPGSRAACVGVSHADTPAALLYLYCFSQPSSFACKNSCTVKPRSSSALRHRYSFCVLLCHFPWASNGRIVTIRGCGPAQLPACAVPVSTFSHLRSYFLLFGVKVSHVWVSTF